MNSLKICLALAVLCIAMLTSSAQDDGDTAWNEYKKEHHLHYDNADEDAKRKALFIKTDKSIKEHNAQYDTWKLTHNKFSVMTPDEKQNWLGGPQEYVPYDKNVQLAKSPPPSITRLLPDTIDFSLDPCMPAVRNQAGCGSCWSFVTVTPLEYNLCKKLGAQKPLDLSEQQLLDCHPMNFGCSGGWPWLSWSYLKNQAKYIATERSYPYISGITKKADSKCRTNKKKMTQMDVSSLNIYHLPENDATAMMNALNDHGPLTVAIYSGADFQLHKSGIYTGEPPTNPPPTNPAIYECSFPAVKQKKYNANHVVVIVGYGTSQDGTPYWLVRNSWGTWWGEGGYAKFLRGKNLCNIEILPVYITL